MTHWMRAPVSVAGLALVALSVAGCDTMGSSQRFANNAPPEQLAPVQGSTVSSGSLPPLAGAVSASAISPGLSGTPVLGGVQEHASLNGGTETILSEIGSTGMTAGGRDLAGGLSVEKLLGGWTVMGGAASCRLNLTHTAKDNTSRYRASAPGCQIPSLGGVGSWQLLGSQIQLFDEADTMIAALQLSGSRFIGTVAGGTAITMAS